MAFIEFVFVKNQEIDWLHCPRGGYGYVQRVPGRVVKVCKKRVSIEVEKSSGEKVIRHVSTDSLRPRGWKD